jgi:hypothetical protein
MQPIAEWLAKIGLERYAAAFTVRALLAFSTSEAEALPCPAETLKSLRL